LKSTLYATSFGSTAAMLGAPWLVAYRSPGYAHLLAGSGILLSLAILALALIPLHEMWVAGRAGGALARALPPGPTPSP
jgi:hypothetical protein